MPQGRMRNPRDPYAEFLERALNCDRIAEKASDPALAKAFKKLAEQWRRSAKLHQQEEELISKDAALLFQTEPKI